MVLAVFQGNPVTYLELILMGKTIRMKCHLPQCATLL